MNWWGLLVVAAGVLLIGVVLLTYQNRSTRSRIIRARTKAFGRLLGKAGEEAWFAKDLRRGTILASLVGVVVIALGVVMVIHGGHS